VITFVGYPVYSDTENRFRQAAAGNDMKNSSDRAGIYDALITACCGDQIFQYIFIF